MNKCQAGHDKHNRKKVNTVLGEMVIYDWENYMNYAGYCTGQDDISRSLDTVGKWDTEVHARMQAILAEGDTANQVIDVGSHIGYFSRLANQMGYTVKAYDADKENLELLKENTEDLPAHTKAKLIWFDGDLIKKKWCTSCSLQKKIELIKIDIEGNEQYAIAYFESCIGVVKNIIMEVSPIFNNSYPKLVQDLVNWGFEVFELDGTPFNFDYSFDQKDLWFKRK